MVITGKGTDVPPLDLHDGRETLHVRKRVLIGPAQGATHYVMRLFTLGQGGATPYHAHPWEHEVYVVRGTGLIKTRDEEIPISAGDFAFVPPEEPHRFLNAGAGEFEFICVVPPEGETGG